VRHGSDLFLAKPSQVQIAHADRTKGKNEGIPLHQLAPFPQIDKYPIIQGSNVTFAYIHSVMRLALTGYRSQMVDLLSEMMDQEPHGFSSVSKRAVAIAGARVELTSPPDLSESEQAKAEEIAKACTAMIRKIPHRAARFMNLAWGIYFGVSGCEVMWKRGVGWEVDSLSFIHSRRLAYPDPTDWALHIWDQGMPQQSMPLGTFGIRVADYPGKFLIHSPSLRGEYPVREGLGRILVAYFTIKRIVLRMSAQEFERFGKPWVLAYFCTNDGKTDMPRSADDGDKDAARNVMRGIGAGSLAGAVLPDSVKIELLKATTELDQDKFLQYLDAAISKACVGQVHTAQPGASGSRAAAEVAKEDTLEIARYDTECFADSFEECLITPFCQLNFPGLDNLYPVVGVHSDKPEALEVIEAAVKLASADAPVDADKVAAQAGVPLLPKNPDNENEKLGRRLRPLKPADSAEPPKPPEWAMEMQKEIAQGKNPNANEDEGAADKSAPKDKGEKKPDVEDA
jgi:phage gp29-like protein